MPRSSACHCDAVLSGEIVTCAAGAVVAAASHADRGVGANGSDGQLVLHEHPLGTMPHTERLDLQPADPGAVAGPAAPQKQFSAA